MRFGLAIGAALTLGALNAQEANAQRAMTVEDLPKIRHALEVAVGPEGRVAYTVQAPRNVLEGEEDAPADSHLYVAAGPDDITGFITGKSSVNAIDFTPDGERISFLAKRDEDEHTALYAIPLDGGEAERVFAHETAIEDYALAPGGETLYFIAQDKAPEEREKLAEKGFKAHAYEENMLFSRLYRVDLSKTDAEPALIELDGEVSNLQLSPSGEYIGATVAPTPLIDDYYMARQIHVVNAGNGRVRSVVETPGKIGHYAFSSDGSQIAFHAGIDEHDPSTPVLMLADSESGAYEAFNIDADYNVMDVAWAGEDQILALIHRGVTSELALFSTGGERQGGLAFEAGIVRDMAFDRSADRMALIADAPSHPRAVFAGTMEGDFAKWSAHNTWLDDIALAEQSVKTYETRDGLEVEGLLLTPDGRKPRRGWPMVLIVHGGPEAHFSNGWITRYSEPGQILAGEGYAVFYPNYRGSTGKGVDFAKAHQNDYAGGEFNDLVDGVEALAAEEIVNADQVGITGGSYGGFASAWGATALSEHFAASVMFVGISDQLSKFGTTDIPNEMYLVHAREWPWEDWAFFLERSPIRHIEKAETPLLILHGEEDTRVHPSQSMEMYRYMKTATDTPVRLVFYPGEGHGNRMAAARLDYAYRLVRWMNHYITGDGGAPPEFMLEADAIEALLADED